MRLQVFSSIRLVQVWLASSKSICQRLYAQPFNEFKPIKRQIVPLIPQPTLSQQHETCLLLFYGGEAGCSTAYYELLLFFYYDLGILASTRDEAATSSFHLSECSENHETPLSTILTVNPTALIITLRLSALSLNSCEINPHHKKGHETLHQKLLLFFGFHFVWGHLVLLKDV